MTATVYTVKLKAGQSSLIVEIPAKNRIDAMLGAERVTRRESGEMYHAGHAVATTLVH